MRERIGAGKDQRAGDIALHRYVGGRAIRRDEEPSLLVASATKSASLARKPFVIAMVAPARPVGADGVASGSEMLKAGASAIPDVSAT